MTKLEQMDELIQKAQENEALQKKFAEILLAEETAEADKWLASLGYQFSLEELQEHMEDGIPLSEDQLDAVAGGARDKRVEAEVRSIKYMMQNKNKPSAGLMCERMQERTLF